MPGRFFLKRPVDQIADHLGCPVPVAEPVRMNIAPGQEIVVFDGAALTRMRWGLIPVGRKNARGRPVMETIVNARSETVFDKSAFDGVGRAVVPVDGWYEWTGQKRRKTPWRIQAQDGSILLFAAITDAWVAPGGIKVPQVATVTCEPNADVRDIHHRMGVILKPDDVDTWISGDAAQAARLLRPWPDGRLCVEQVTDVDWDGA